MKRYIGFIYVFMALLSVWLALPASAAQIYTATVTATGGTAEYAITPGYGGIPVVTSLGWTVTDAAADVDIYIGTGTETMTSAAITATATTFAVGSCTGLNESTYVVIANQNGDTSEFATVSSCTGGVLTTSALSNSYRTKASVFEMVSTYSFANVGIGSDQKQVIIKGYKDMPVVAKLSGVSGSSSIDFLTVEWR